MLTLLAVHLLYTCALAIDSEFAPGAQSGRFARRAALQYLACDVACCVTRSVVHCCFCCCYTLQKVATITLRTTLIHLQVITIAATSWLHLRREEQTIGANSDGN